MSTKRQVSNSETLPVRIQLSRRRGFRLPPNCVVVSRQAHGRGRFGNPYRVGVHGTAEECVRMFERDLEAALARQPAAPDFEAMAVELPQLRGKNAACWCRPGNPCHGDVLIRLANRTKQTSVRPDVVK